MFFPKTATPQFSKCRFWAE